MQKTVFNFLRNYKFNDSEPSDLQNCQFCIWIQSNDQEIKKLLIKAA
jgi:hypothetical protein